MQVYRDFFYSSNYLCDEIIYLQSRPIVYIFSKLPFSEIIWQALNPIVSRRYLGEQEYTIIIKNSRRYLRYLAYVYIHIK